MFDEDDNSKSKGKSECDGTIARSAEIDERDARALQREEVQQGGLQRFDAKNDGDSLQEQMGRTTSERRSDYGDDDDKDEWLLSCQCDTAKPLYTLLSCLQQAVSTTCIGGGGGESSGATGGTSGRRQQQHRKGSNPTSQLRKSYSSVSVSRGAKSKSARRNQPVTVFCSPSNMTFHIFGNAKQLQASVDLHSGMFCQYHVHAVGIAATQDDDTDNSTKLTDVAGGQFCVSLDTLLDCLQILGAHTLESTKVSLSYNYTKEIFKVELLQEQSGVLATAAIPGLITPELQDVYNDDGDNDYTDRSGMHNNIHAAQCLTNLSLAFRSSPIAARMIIQSHVLKEFVQEIEWVAGATCATLSMSRNKGLELEATGHFGECLVSLPPKGSHMVSLEVPPSAASVMTSRIYPLASLLGSLLRGSEIASETCLTMNQNGMMAIQHQVLLSSPTVASMDDYRNNSTVDQNSSQQQQPNYVDFIICCLREEEDENDTATMVRDDDGDDENCTLERSVAITSQRSSVCSSAPAATVRNERRVPRHRLAGTARDDDSDTIDPKNDDEEDDSDEDESHLLSASAAHLFGKVVTNKPRIGNSEKVLADCSEKGEKKAKTRQSGSRSPSPSVSSSPDTTGSNSLRTNTGIGGAIGRRRPRRQRHVNAVNEVKPQNHREQPRAKRGTTNDDSSSTEDGESEHVDEDDDDDELDVTAEATSVASRSSSRRRQQRGRERRRTTSRTSYVYEDHDEDEEGGCSSPEVLYGET